TWSTSTEPERIFSAARLSAEDAKHYGAPDGAEAFEIRLSPSRSVPFELNVFQTLSAPARPQSPFRAPDGVDVPLLFLPEASIESAEFSVQSPREFPFWTRSSFMTAIPTRPRSPDAREPMEKRFRYAPRATAPGASPNLAILRTAPSPDGGVALATPETLDASAQRWFETLDSFFEPSGLARNRATYYIENRGLDSILFKFPRKLGAEATRDVWVDDRRAAWEIERIDDETSGIRVALPTDRRFVCIGLEYYSTGPRLSLVGKLTPTRPTCDLPSLSGVWRVWAPPEFLFCERSGANSRRAGGIAQFMAATRDFFSSPWARTRTTRAAAERFVKRFGDDAALRAACAARREDSTVPTALAWGTIFGDARVVDALFAPDADAELGDAANSLESPFGPLAKTAPFALYVDRFSLARIRLTPNAELPSLGADSLSPNERAARIFETAGAALLFLDEKTALLTSSDALDEFDSLEATPLLNSRFRRVASAAEARRFRETLASGANPRYVVASLWRDSTAVSPWSERAQMETSPGWIRTSLPLSRAASGALVANRYAASAFRLFFITCFVVFTWGRAYARPRFFIATFGVCVAIRCVSSFSATLIADALGQGALAGLVLFYARLYSGTPIKTAVSGTLKRRPIQTATPGLKKSPPPRATAVAPEPPVESTQGFVDLASLPQAAIAAASGRPTAQTSGPLAPPSFPPPAEKADAVPTKGASDVTIVNSPTAPDEESIEAELDVENDDESTERRGATRLATAAALLCAALVLAFAVGAARSQDGDARPAANPVAEPAAEKAWREPYRVFVPRDENREIGGEYYWISSEFYEKIRAALRVRPRERNWRIESALYEGALNYNSFDDSVSLFSLKATFAVFIEGSSATIALPAAQLMPYAGAKFDKLTVSPVIEENSQELLFELEGVEPGEHELELALAPPQFAPSAGGADGDSDAQISIPIPRTANARFELTIPSDAPEFDVPNALGKVGKSSGKLTAELGPVDRLILAKRGSSGKFGGPALDVEQYFLMRPRAAPRRLKNTPSSP
ncbi:MAG: hypothetical protein HUK22_04990, partial [Thermoguttaceae bacterium]|nr:hypothetical protein [Thermoguttaceae bacterium]